MKELVLVDVTAYGGVYWTGSEAVWKVDIVLDDSSSPSC